MSSDFKELIEQIYIQFEEKWNNDYQLLSDMNDILKKALQGDWKAEVTFKKQIEEYLMNEGISNIDYPKYYKNLIEAIYHENWGLAGLAEWFSDKYGDSSSAKIIGDRIYFLVEGEAKLMPQRIDDKRRKQLIAKLLTIKPDERKDKDVNEIYLIDGTRVTIFNSSVSKQDVIVFRRYIIPEYTFEEQAKRGTIPGEAIPLFKSMVELGYNVAFTGAVRTAKSTFLTTWQSYENPKYEGLLIETDPEIPLHTLMPEAPIIQLVTSDERQLSGVIKHILRSDSDYIIMGEARDGAALDAAVRIANKGTRRCKLTFHNRFPQDFSYDVASEIVRTEGGDVALIAEKVAQSVDYIFHFIQLSDKSQKRLDGMYELTINKDSGDIITTQICKYVEQSDSWIWNKWICTEHEKTGRKENQKIFEIFENQMNQLEEQFPPNAAAAPYIVNYRKER